MCNRKVYIFLILILEYIWQNLLLAEHYGN